MKWYRLVIASKAKQSQFLGLRLPRRGAPRNDIYGSFSFCYTLLVLALLLLISSAALGAAKKSKPLLPDGFYLAHIEGRLIASEPNEILEANQDRWFFELASKVTDGKTTLMPGAILELLPSSALERMINDTGASSQSSYLLWARATKYHSKNYLFAERFRGLTERKKQIAPTDTNPQKSVLSDTNDVLTLSPEMIKKLKHGSGIRTEKLNTVKKSTLEYATDRLMPNRMGTIRLSQEKISTQPYLSFSFDSFGRAIDPNSLILLPCETLQNVEKKQSEELEPLRYRVTGILTKYRENKYLLLQRATRVYSHQNLGR
jgi:hypothetical protein